MIRRVDRFPHAVRSIEHCWIPLSDGCRLAARIWLPSGAERGPVPAILEYIPYGKREGTRERDEPMHGYFAGHGYAALRVDVRGTGDSEGVLCDEYDEQELSDGEEVIAWIAAQPWCDGSVGMLGKSWGGFNALQIAARRPPALRAVISVCASDDRYADDAHYMGGCLLTENFIWGAMLFGLVAQPPDPELVGDAWREAWLLRLQHTRPFALRWLEHPLRDEYWRHGSVCEDFARIECPVYAIGGWADGYSNAVPRLLAGLSGPRKGLVGPWAHVYPHEGIPGPAIGFLQEALRWWDHWLRHRDTGILQEPMYRVWMQQSMTPASSLAERPGRWVAEACWPSPRIESRVFALGREGLREPATDAAQATPLILELSSPQTTGGTAGTWCGFGFEGELPLDQRPDDGRSLCFDSEPLTAPLEILGAARVTLSLRVDRSRAFIVARLCDVAPDGSSLRVTYGLRNLAHSDAHRDIQTLDAHTPIRVTFQLNDVAHAFPAGHRLRLALATSYWPLVWPSPEPVRMRLDCDESRLELPVRPPRPEDERLRPFAAAEAAPRPPVVTLDPGGVSRRVERDLASGEVRYVVTQDLRPDSEPARAYIPPIDLQVGYGIREELRIREGDPLSARAEIEHTSSARRKRWSVRVTTRTCVTCSRDEFRIEARLLAEEGDAIVLERRWDERVARRGV